MGTFDNLYLNQIKKLQEENKKLRAMLNETIDDYGELEDGVNEIDEPDLPKKTRKQLEDEAARSAEWLARKHEEGRKRLLELGFDVHDPKYNLSPSIIKLLTGPR